MLVGIDNLGVINESYGYAAADEVIVEICKRISSVTGQYGVVGRVAGNKFGVVLPGCVKMAMPNVATRLLHAVRGNFIDTEAGPVSATISAGCLSIDETVPTVINAMSKAEEALTQAKDGRHDNFVIFEPSAMKESQRRNTASMGETLISALNDRRLVLAYQPIVNAESGEADHYECLLRLLREDGELLSAGAFIPVAEKLGFVRLIDQRVLELVAEALLSSDKARLSVNVSGMTTADTNWIKDLSHFLRSKPEAAERLVVEITETVAIDDIEESAKFVSAVKDLGCKVAIDDFGAGYTSFRNLKALDVDMVKIDGSFIKGLSENRDNQFFARTLVELARNFRLATVAEWVGGDVDMNLLRTYGVDYFQGFHLGAPSVNTPWQASKAEQTVH